MTTDREIIAQLVEALKPYFACWDQEVHGHGPQSSIWQTVHTPVSYAQHEKARAALAAAERVAEPRDPSEEALKAALAAYLNLGEWYPNGPTREERLRAALRASYRIDGIAAPLPPVESGWRTMESAPKDGTPIQTGRRSEFWSGHVFYPLTSKFIEGKWCALFGRNEWAPFDPQPNCWRQLPPPPEKEG